jgi:prepilin-type N-terminal cleavage/methylation domain
MQNRGFTLVESLMVMLVVAFFTLVPMLSVKSVTETMEVTRFFEQLEKNLLVCQQTAIISNRATDISQNDANHRSLNFRLASGEWLPALTVPESLTIANLSGKITFAGGTGNVDATRKILFTWPQKKQQITYKFLFGKGRFEQEVTTL